MALDAAPGLDLDLTDPESFGPHPTVTVDEPLTATGDTEPPSAASGAGLARGALDTARLRPALAQLAQAVQALHDAGLLHLDIKPGNIMVDREGRVVLLDFGLVRELQVDDGTSEHVLGTPAYMAPEQAAGAIAGPAADWYAVGGVMYRALTGRLPFLGSSIAVMLAKQTQRPAAPSSFLAGIPEDLEQLCLDLLSTAPEDRPAGPEVLARLGVERSAARFHVPERPLLGRERELAQLHEAFELGRRGLVLCHVAGVSGMGKSALLDHLLSELSAEATVLRGRCHQRESVPYKAFDGLMDGLALELGRATWRALRGRHLGAIRDLGRLFPAFRELLPRDEPRTDELDDVVEARRRAFRALRIILAQLARQRPLVLCIDDVQWSDHDSARLLDDLLAARDAPEMLVLLSYRSDEAERSPMLRQLERAGQSGQARHRSLRVEVGPLDEETAMRLLDTLTPAEPVVGDAKQIVREAEGSPLFLEQLVRHALAEPGEVDEPSGEISISALIRAQLGALEPAERRLVTTLCLLGRPVELGLALRASDLEPAEAFRLVRRLEARYLIRSHGPGLLDLVEAHHDRVREVVEQRLEPELARDAHRRIAATLGDAADVAPERLAEHLHGAGMLAEAARASAAAAERAAASLAFEHAATLYQRAIQWLGDSDPATRDSWARRRAEALAHAGRAEEAADAMLALADAAAGNDALTLRTQAAEMLLACGLIERGTQVIAPVAREVGQPIPRSDAVALLELLRHMAAFRLLGTRVAGGPPSSEIDRQIDLCLAMGKGFAAFNPVLSGVYWLRGLRLALRHGDPRFAARGLAHFGLMTMYAGTPAAVRRGEELTRRGEALERALDDPYLRGAFAISRGVGATACGEWTAAIQHIERGVALYDETGQGARFERTVGETTLIPCQLWRGDLAQADIRSHALARAGDEVGDLFSGVFGQIFLGHAALARGDVAAARDLVRRARERWTRQHFTALHMFMVRLEIQCDLAEDMPGQAVNAIERAWPDINGAHLLGFQIWRIELGLLRAGARAALSATQPDGRAVAARKLRKEARALEREGRTWALAAARVVEASAAALEGQTAAAQAALEAAARAYRDADMRVHAACVDLRRASLGQGAGPSQARASALELLREEGVETPEPLVRALVPGWFGAPQSA